MIPELRKAYNEAFTPEKYQAFVQDLFSNPPGELDFRVAETPLFHALSEKAIPRHLRIPHEDAHPHCIVFDFGICTGADGTLEPQLIEMQGFPSLFAYQVLLPEVSARHFGKPKGLTNYLGGLDKEGYLAALRRLILADEDPKHVVLLELFPEQQKTRIDFAATKAYLGIETVTARVEIRRIYNRLIFDLSQQPAEIQKQGKLLQEDLDVMWVPHPNWFYRLSKYTLPFIHHPNVPPTQFLRDVWKWPADMENYVAKPLFSFAGQGVIVDVTREALEAIPDPENWILQRKVQYAAVIDTPDEPAKAEIRIFYFWEPGTPRPVPTNNLARLCKVKLVGVDYNKDKGWVIIPTPLCPWACRTFNNLLYRKTAPSWAG
ncbi:hypothetical protein N657DRAFT_683560 [Parathielavia appendiculata]|uniref:Uncharacterized protein n=1 Tax=Parathielavia appendiculata TaxID=2587402 RepID=A0AAN6TTH8_9PEZI|nr:hypothetical protein N657DRAFT_683560 [Parathielavia appendiculata]